MTAPVNTNNAVLMLEDLLKQWGLGGLTGSVRGMLMAGDTADIIPIKLRQTPEYKQRFSANEDRRAKGLPVLSEAEYIKTEEAYKDTLRRAGLNEYASSDNLKKWLGFDVSPVEMDARVKDARDRFINAPDTVKQFWGMHGLDASHAIRSMLDPTLSEADLQRNLHAGQIGGEAISAYGNNYDVGTDQAQAFARAGVTVDQARKGFAAAAGMEPDVLRQATMAGVKLDRTDLQKSELLGDPTASRKIREVGQTDRAQYQGSHQGAARGALETASQGQY